MIKLIHPKTGTAREVDETNHNKIALLKRAGFVFEKNYKPPKPPKIVAEKSIADAVKDNAVDQEEAEAEDGEPEVAIHVSATARALIEKNDLDPALIEGSGRDGQITKPDVEKLLEDLEEEEPEMEGDGSEEVDPPAEEEAPPAAEIPTHDDPEPPAKPEDEEAE